MEYKVITVTLEHTVSVYETDDYSDAVTVAYDMGKLSSTENVHLVEYGEWGYDNPNIYANDMPDIFETPDGGYNVVGDDTPPNEPEIPELFE